jgi:hypothetical protein
MEIGRLYIIRNILSILKSSKYCVHIFYKSAADTYYVGQTYMVSF